MLRAGRIPTRASPPTAGRSKTRRKLFPHWLEPASGVVKALIEI